MDLPAWIRHEVHAACRGKALGKDAVIAGFCKFYNRLADIGRRLKDFRSPMIRQECVLLVNPPWITRDNNIWHGIKGAMPPLSLLSIGAVLERAGFSVKILDAHVDRLSEAEIAREIAAVQPSFLGITMMTSTAIASHRIAQIAKEGDSNITVVVGGVHADALPDETLRNRSIDFVVRADGEYTMLEICQRKDPSTITGASYRADGRVVHNPSRPVLMDLGQLPQYAYHLVPMHKYYPAVGAYRKLPAINMLMTRGCPGKCIFCNSAETTLRTRPAAKVVDEIIHLRDTYGIREIQFYDDTFTVMKKNVLEFCRLMEEKKVGVTFSCFARTDCLNQEMAMALKKAGCHQIMFGVESGSQKILKILRKDIDLERTKEAVRLVKKTGMEVRTAFIFGTLGETEETIEETLRYAIEIDPDLAIFNITTPYPGTQFYAWTEANDALLTKDWWDYELGNSIVEIPTISRAKIRAMYDKAFKAFYNRPKIYLRRLLKIRSLSLLKDTLEAFTYIVLKQKVGGRGLYKKEWLKHRREDFFDFDFSQPPSPNDARWAKQIRDQIEELFPPDTPRETELLPS